MEYTRTATHQFCDTDLCMVIDKITGELERFGGANAIIPFDEALEYLVDKKGWEDRTVIVKMKCVQGFKL